MRTIFLDTEYLSLSKKYSEFKFLIKYKNRLYPEIIQIGAYKFENIFTKNKTKKLNLYFKIQQFLPKRISKLTGINQNLLNLKGRSFKDNIQLLLKFLKDSDIIFVNGEDLKLIKLNMAFNKIKRFNKKFYFVNLRNLTGNLDTKKLLKFHNIKNIKLHDAFNDCLILSKFLKKFININGQNKFLNIIKNNKKIIKF
jgi:DNA polymerase III epsilon subunit-like protein